MTNENICELLERDLERHEPVRYAVGVGRGEDICSWFVKKGKVKPFNKLESTLDKKGQGIHLNFEAMGKCVWQALAQAPWTEFNKLAIDFKKIVIEEEREDNKTALKRLEKTLFEKHLGKYVVIAKGQLQAVGDSLEDVRDVALDTNHRYVFKVEKPKRVKVSLGWQIKRK